MSLFDRVQEAIEISQANPTVIDARFVQPFDFDTLYTHVPAHEKIIIVEEGVFGGGSSVILETLLTERRFNIIPKITFLNVDKSPIDHTSRTTQLNLSPLSSQKLAKLLK